MWAHVSIHVCVFTGVTILSCDALLIKLPEGANAWEKIILRYGSYATVMCTCVVFERHYHGPTRTRWCRQHLYGGVSLATSNLCFVNSLQRANAAMVLSVLASAPLWAVLLGKVFLGEATPLHTVRLNFLLVTCGRAAARGLGVRRRSAARRSYCT